MAGVLNSVGFVAVYTSHMTGPTAMAADHLVLGDLRLVAVGVLAVAFTCGAACCALLFNWAQRRGLHRRYANVLLLEGLLMLAWGLLAESPTGAHRVLLFVPVLAFTMGLQNAVVTEIPGARIRTTHVTGMVTDIGIELGRFLYRNRLVDPGPVTGDAGKLRLLAALVGLFFAGGVLGALGYPAVGLPVLVPTALTLLVAAWRPLAADLGLRRSSAS